MNICPPPQFSRHGVTAWGTASVQTNITGSTLLAGSCRDGHTHWEGVHQGGSKKTVQKESWGECLLCHRGSVLGVSWSLVPPSILVDSWPGRDQNLFRGGKNKIRTGWVLSSALSALLSLPISLPLSLPSSLPLSLPIPFHSFTCVGLSVSRRPSKRLSQEGELCLSCAYPLSPPSALHYGNPYPRPVSHSFVL